MISSHLICARTGQQHWTSSRFHRAARPLHCLEETRCPSPFMVDFAQAVVHPLVPMTQRRGGGAGRPGVGASQLSELWAMFFLRYTALRHRPSIINRIMAEAPKPVCCDSCGCLHLRVVARCLSLSMGMSRVACCVYFCSDQDSLVNLLIRAEDTAVLSCSGKLYCP